MKKKQEKKNINKLLKVVGGVFLGIIFLILALYFITSYNSTVVYSVSLNNDSMGAEFFNIKTLRKE